MSDKRKHVSEVIEALETGTATPEEQRQAASALDEALPCMAILHTIADAMGGKRALDGLLQLLMDAGAKILKLDATQATEILKSGAATFVGPEILDPRNPKAQRGN